MHIHVIMLKFIRTCTVMLIIIDNRVNEFTLPYSAKFSRAVNFADFANSNSIAKIIFVKITIFDLLRPKLILTCVVNKKTRPAHVKMAVPRALLK